MNAEGELVDTGLLAAKIEDANLGVGHTTVEARLRVRLLSIAVSGIFSGCVSSSSPPLAPFSPSLALQISFRSGSSVAAAGRIIRTLFLQ